MVNSANCSRPSQFLSISYPLYNAGIEKSDLKSYWSSLVDTVIHYSIMSISSSATWPAAAGPLPLEAA